MIKIKGALLAAIAAIIWLSGSGWAQTCGKPLATLSAAEKLVYEVDAYFYTVHAGRPYTYGYAEVYYSGTGLDNLVRDSRIVLKSAQCLENNVDSGRDMDVACGCNKLRIDVSSLQEDMELINSTKVLETASYRLPIAQCQWRKVMEAYNELLYSVGS